MRLRFTSFAVQLAAWILLALPVLPAARADALAGAAGLESQYQQLQGELAGNQFKRPLYLKSSEGAGAVKGDIHAVLAYPFAQVREALASPENWCDILILHLNTKYCRLSSAQGKTGLRMHVGKKIEQDLSDTYRVDFTYRSGAADGNYFSSSMQADKGPLDTGDYRIQIEAIPLPDGRSFLHLSYSYSYGMASKLALRAYLMTVGRDKVGFTVTRRDADGQPHYVDGTRATVERNTMRYYLAIDAYLAGLSAPPAQRLEKRLDAWFAATEQYPRQLHEVDREAYLSMKRNEYARQQKPAD
ncbi:hypothetical protein Herbaro_04630 [Herbaspirillum sp. WKF16]|uniref:hypothetical protein n=1 Tax=Herbaspirillum sp. WKF16 TaxID=3028312 RepID=UPI0023A9E004|nr:hypothetical protein [Herbaspirillum sp. WKF16]WDZ97083.1 hypothetical protein Herbaro_04630 [Herbaspirillum sp. WKF16]